MIENYLDEIDRDMKTYSLKYENFDCTFVLRNEIVSKYRSSFGKGNKSIKLNKYTLFRLLVSIFTNFITIFSKSKFWVFSNAERRKLIDGIYVDRVSSLVQEFLGSTLYIENPIISRHRKPVNDRIFSDSFFYLIAFLISKVWYNKAKVSLIGNIEFFEKKYNIEINIDTQLRRYFGQYLTMKCFLKLKKPKFVFMVYPNGYNGYIRAFKENNIPVIELQHGIIYSEHYSYKCSLKNDLFYFRPDYILTYGKCDKETLIGINFLPEKKIIVIGSYSLWLYKNKVNVFSDYIQKLVGHHISGEKITISVTATVNDLEYLIEIANKVVEIEPKYIFFILPRLSSQSNVRPKEGVQILDIHKTNVYELIKICDYHLTHASTTALEALFFRKKTFVFEKNEGQSLFRINYPYINSLNYVSTVENLLNELKANTEENDSSIDLLFESNLESQFKEFINEL